MTKIAELQKDILKAAANNGGKLWVLTPGWYTTPEPNNEGPWGWSTVNKLISSGLMIEVGDDVALTDAGREALKDQAK